MGLNPKYSMRDIDTQVEHTSDQKKQCKNNKTIKSLLPLENKYTWEMINLTRGEEESRTSASNINTHTFNPYTSKLEWNV